MLHCPRCQQPTEREAVTCSHCGMTLKAYGHPGIPLHRASGDASLCESCIYDADDTCTFPQRPHARECTLYTDISQPQRETVPVYKPNRNALQAIAFRYRQNPLLFGLLTLGGASLLLTLVANS
jgi:hypothetical protein